MFPSCEAFSESTTLDILKILAGGLIGSFIGSYLAHLFTMRRDRDARKRSFRGFLAEWRAIVEQTTDQGAIPPHYFDHVRSFRREAERVREDFSDSEAFSARVVALGYMTPQAIRGDGAKQSRDILADEIDAFLEFIRNA